MRNKRQELVSSLFVFAVAMATLLSCSLSPKVERVAAQGYEFAAPPKDRWSVIRGAHSDAPTYQASGSGAVMGMNSLCGRYRDSTLSGLAKDLSNSLEAREEVKSQTWTVLGREVPYKVYRGKLDGVVVELQTTVLRLRDCVLDFSISQVGEVGTSELEDFRAFVQSFQWKGLGP